MKKPYLISVFLFFIAFLIFGDNEDQEEIDYLLFLPNSSNMFVNQEQAMVQLDNIAKYLTGREIASGQICVYGYTAFAANDVDPVSLSTNRAFFVISELQKRGVHRSLFSDPVGHGSVDLWGGNINEESRHPNRRVRVVLDGNVIMVEPSGEVIESEILPPAVSDSEIEISNADTYEKPLRNENTGLLRKKFPWWILLPLLLFLFIPFIFSKNRKRPINKAPKPKKVEPPPPAPPVAASENVETRAVPAAASENIAAAAVVLPAASEKAEEPSSAVETSESVVYLEEEIRYRAYEHYLMRNGENGSMDEDWYKALPEVCAKYEAAGYQTYSDGCWWARKSFSRNI
jgi:hypothetical protein